MTTSKSIITLEERPSAEILAAISSGVRHFNAPYFGMPLPEDVCLIARDELHTIIGGITGALMGDHLRIDWVWVDAAHRGQGLGSQLLGALDVYAGENNCQFIQLDTYDFQARPFYEKCGYICVGTIEKWLHGRDCHFMRKTL